MSAWFWIAGSLLLASWVVAKFHRGATGLLSLGFLAGAATVIAVEHPFA